MNNNKIAQNWARQWYGPFMLVLCLFIAVPVDIISTALWYDTQGWRIILTDASGWLGRLNDLFINWGFAFSTEAMGFSLLIFLAQVGITYQFLELPWYDNNPRANIVDVFKKIKAGNFSGISGKKLWTLAGLIGVILFDSMTSFEYRQEGQLVAPLRTVALVFLFDNVMSEVFLTMGAASTITLLVATWNSIKPGRSSSGQRQKQSKQGGNASQSRQRDQQQRQQQPPQQRSGPPDPPPDIAEMEIPLPLSRMMRNIDGE